MSDSDLETAIKASLDSYNEELKKSHQTPMQAISFIVQKPSFTHFLQQGNLTKFIKNETIPAVKSASSKTSLGPKTYPGMQNLSAFCFANAVFQVLVAFKPFEQFLGPGVMQPKSKENSASLVLNHLQQVLQDLNQTYDEHTLVNIYPFFDLLCSQKKIISGHVINLALNQLCPQSASYVKQGTGEDFFLLLLDVLDNIFDPFATTWVKIITSLASSPKKFSDTVTATIGKTVDLGGATFSDIEQTAIFNMLNPDTKSMYLQPKEDADFEGSPRVSYKYLAKTNTKGIVFLVNRQDSSGKKIVNPIDIEANIDIYDFEQFKNALREEKIPFSLCGFTLHQGIDKAGHYVAYAKRGTTWYLFDDDKVPQVWTPNFKDSKIQKNVVMLFYNREEVITV